MVVCIYFIDHMSSVLAMHCPLGTVYFDLYNVECALFNEHCAVFNVHCWVHLGKERGRALEQGGDMSVSPCTEEDNGDTK